MVEGGNSTRGLIIISKLYQEGRIDDDQREQLKGVYTYSHKQALSNPFFLM